MRSERVQKQFEFRLILESLRGFGCGTVLHSPLVRGERQQQLRALLREIELEVREDYRKYQQSYNSPNLTHPSMTKWEEEEAKLYERS